MPPSKDEASLDDDEFVVPEDPVEQECFKRRLMATESEVTYNKSGWHVPSKHSSAAPTVALARW